MQNLPFVSGSDYSHSSIIQSLKVGNSGGIRASVKDGKVERIVLFSTSDQFANPNEIPYQDRTDGKILTYTGTGKIGNQNLSGQNLRLTQQDGEFFPIYVFSLLSHRKSAGSPENRWRFSGIYKYLDHSRENQVDLLGADRNAWIFKLYKLDIREAHPIFEPKLREFIKQSYANPKLSCKALLGDTGRIPAEVIQDAIAKMNRMEPVSFEEFVKMALITSNFRDVRTSKKSADGGIDIVALMPASIWPIESQIIQVQVKRWQRAVGRKEVAELRGSLIPRAIGVLVTTGNYAGTAIREADRPNMLPVSLVDGTKLATVAIRLNLEIV